MTPPGEFYLLWRVGAEHDWSGPFGSAAEAMAAAEAWGDSPRHVVAVTTTVGVRPGPGNGKAPS